MCEAASCERLAEISAAAAAQAKSALQQVREHAIGVDGDTSYAGDTTSFGGRYAKLPDHAGEMCD